MTQTTDIHAAIEAINNSFKEFVKSGDADFMSALNSQDGQVLPRNSDFATDQESIQSFWQSVMELGIKVAKLEIIEAESNGNTPIENPEDEQTSSITKRDFGLTWD